MAEKDDYLLDLLVDLGFTNAEQVAKAREEARLKAEAEEKARQQAEAQRQAAEKAKAEAEAKAVQATADGEAYAKLKVATAEADALKVQNNALAQNKDVLELRRIEVEQIKASRWNGQLPTSIYAGAPIPFMSVH